MITDRMRDPERGREAIRDAQRAVQHGWQFNGGFLYLHDLNILSLHLLQIEYTKKFGDLPTDLLQVNPAGRQRHRGLTARERRELERLARVSKSLSKMLPCYPPCP